MELLIVEDENMIGNYLQQGITEAGFVVDLARNGLYATKPTRMLHLFLRTNVSETART